MAGAATTQAAAFDPGAAFARLAETDFTSRLPFAVLGSLFVILRAPFLPYGYGTDPDAWRVALTGEYLIHHGKYFPSRLPGNPLHELLITPLVPLGWVATGLATVLVSLLCVYLFARIVKGAGLPNRGFLVIGFAFTPLLFINSMSTMDYMWALTCILGAYLATTSRNPLLAGLLIGIAAGFRLQSLAATVPLSYLFLRQGPVSVKPWLSKLPMSGAWLRLLPFGAAALSAFVLAFTPVLAVYGTSFWNFYDASINYQDVVRLLSKESLGILGSLGVLVGVALTLPRLRHLPADLKVEPETGAWLLFIAMWFVVFLRLPHEIAYLIPVFPFGYLVMGRYMTRAVLGGVVAAILIAGVVDITTPGEALNLDQVRSAQIGRGLVLSNLDTMKTQRSFVEKVMAAPVPDHSVVMAGFIYPQLAMRERKNLDIRILERDYEAISMLSDRGEAVDTKHDIRYVWLLTQETFAALRSQGYSFYLVPDAAGGTYALYNYRPPLFGATFLNIDQGSPSQGKGTANTKR